MTELLRALRSIETSKQSLDSYTVGALLARKLIKPMGAGRYALTSKGMAMLHDLKSGIGKRRINAP